MYPKKSTQINVRLSEQRGKNSQNEMPETVSKFAISLKKEFFTPEN